MHTVFFEMKQGHLASVRFMRGEAATAGLTPARLDMIRVLAIRPRNGLTQHALRRLLGNCKAVVSVMVRSLEALGFVSRERCADDRRTFVVRVTDKGLRAIRKVFYEARTSGYLDVALTTTFSRSHPFRKGWERTVDRLEAGLRSMRAAHGISEPEQNPWRCDEGDELLFYDDVPSNPNRIDIIPSEDEVLSAELRSSDARRARRIRIDPEERDDR